MKNGRRQKNKLLEILLKNFSNKNKRKLFIIIISLVLVLFGIKLFRFSCINLFVEKPNFFSRVTTIIRSDELDETWDFEKMPDRDDYYIWSIGLKSNKIIATRIRSGITVAPKVVVELKMNYSSMEDYYKGNGPRDFRKFIKEYSER